MTALALTDAQLLALGLSAQTLSEIDSMVRAQHAAAACARVEGAVAQQWRDVTAWGDDCREAAAALASYSLLGRRGFGSGTGADAAVKNRYDAAEAWLALVADGRRDPSGGFAATRIVRAHVSSEPSRRRGSSTCGGCSDGFRVRR